MHKAILSTQQRKLLFSALDAEECRKLARRWKGDPDTTVADAAQRLEQSALEARATLLRELRAIL